MSLENVSVALHRGHSRAVCRRRACVHRARTCGSRPRSPAPAAPAAPRRQPPPGGSAAPAAASAAKDISDLIPARDLEALSSSTPKPLFNPDAPFSVRSEPINAPAPSARGGRSFGRIAAVVAGLLALGAAGVVAPHYFKTAPVPAANATTTGTLIVQSNPAGVQVFVDGVDRGMTPARISVTPGSHILELRGRGVPRVIPLRSPPSRFRSTLVRRHADTGRRRSVEPPFKVTSTVPARVCAVTLAI